MDDGGVRSRDRNSRIPEARRNCPPRPTTRSSPDTHLDPMGHGWDMLHVAYRYGYGAAPAVHTSQSSLDLLDAPQVFTRERAEGVSILGEQ